MLDLDSEYLGEEHLMLREQFRKYVQSEIVPKTEEWEALGSLPKAAYLALGELGFLGVSIPEDWGGAGFDTLGAPAMGALLGPSRIMPTSPHPSSPGQGRRNSAPASFRIS